MRSTKMNSRSARKNLFELLWIAVIVTWACLSTQVLFGVHQASTGTQGPPVQTPAATAAPHPVEGETFVTPQQAADALIAAAGKYDEAALAKIFGPHGKKVIFTGEAAQDRQRALGFAAEAKEKTTVAVDPKTGTRAFIIVGDENWPFPVPIIKINGKWSFDAKAGEQELLYRRIGSNELDAIQICRGFVESQDEYALRSRQLYNVNQYAQRIVSTPGKQDGLTWQTANGTWEGPIGEQIAKAIAQGYTPGEMPFHGYFYKVLKGQGPAAPLGQLDYVIEGVMIGGFALVAAPAQYRVTGVKTFIVSYDGVVYEKDLGPDTIEHFKKMERFNPDLSWHPVNEQ
jgi:Protein of unknown function (DUF2950)